MIVQKKKKINEKKSDFFNSVFYKKFVKTVSNRGLYRGLPNAEIPQA